MSARDHADIVEAQFVQEAELGAMLKVEASKAKEEYGADLAVASLVPWRSGMAATGWFTTRPTDSRSILASA